MSSTVATIVKTFRPSSFPPLVPFQIGRVVSAVVSGLVASSESALFVSLVEMMCVGVVLFFLHGWCKTTGGAFFLYRKNCSVSPVAVSVD